MLLSQQQIAPLITGIVGRSLTVYEEIDTTSNAVKTLAHAGAPHGSVVMAVSQTQGRGRQGRSFQSLKGAGIYLSALLRLPLPAEQALLITAAAAVAVSDAIQDVCKLETRIKWVNDIYCQGRKLCGILAESALTQGGILDYIVLGIGINVEKQQFSPELAGKAGALEQFCEGTVDQNKLAAAVCNRLSQVCEQMESRAFIPVYRQRSCVIGRKVLVVCGQEQVPAHVLDINEQGYLVVRYEPSGKTGILSTGEISLQGDFR